MHSHLMNPYFYYCDQLRRNRNKHLRIYFQLGRKMIVKYYQLLLVVDFMNYNSMQ